jgi:hypothetical protein
MGDQEWEDICRGQAALGERYNAKAAAEKKKKK